MYKFQENDQALFEAIEAYRNGNKDKATFIYESTKKYTYKIVHQEVERFKSQGVLTGDAISITEDVMQDLYMEFFNKIEKFRNEDPRSIFKWISVVSHRMLLGYVDENKTEVLQFAKEENFREESDIWDSSEVNDGDLEVDHEMLPEAALEDKEFQQMIFDFIQSLPEVQAQTVLLHFRGGMKYQEIADEMGVSLITVKTRMKKAKDLLEKIIIKYENKTGTKLHSVSILPLLSLLYRMSSESKMVPVAVDMAVTGSLAGATSAGVGSVATVGVTKAIGTRVLIGIVSATVVIGGSIVGSQLVKQEQEVKIKKEQEEQGDTEELHKDNSKENPDKGSIQEPEADVEEGKTEDEPNTNQENKEQPPQEDVITISQEEIEARRTINQAYREVVIGNGGSNWAFMGTPYQFGVADVNGDGVKEILLYTYNPSTQNDLGPDFILTYDGEVCGAGKGFGSLHNMEYCVDTKYFMNTYYYEDGSYDFRIYEFNGKYFGPVIIYRGTLEEGGDFDFSFHVDTNGNYSFGGKDNLYYDQKLTAEQKAYVENKIKEYFPYKTKATAPYQINENTLNECLPIDDEGIKQQLINEKR